MSGAALVSDTVAITVRNTNFGFWDDVLFLVGFIGLWVTCLALAVHLSRGHAGWKRVGVAAAVFVGVVAVLGVLSFAMDFIGRHTFSAANVGLHGEWSFFIIGVCLLALAGWVWRSAASDSPAAAPTI